MHEIINVNLNDNHEPVVSGRQLHEALGGSKHHTLCGLTEWLSMALQKIKIFCLTIL